MGKPKNDYRRNVIWTIRNYPARVKLHEELCRQSFGTDSSGTGTTEISRKVEALALKEMAPMLQREYEAVTRAITITQMLPNGSKRMELISRKYWQNGNVQMKHVIHHIGVAEATGWRWHNDFVELVAQNLGYKKQS